MAEPDEPTTHGFGFTEPEPRALIPLSGVDGSLNLRCAQCGNEDFRRFAARIVHRRVTVLSGMDSVPLGVIDASQRTTIRCLVCEENGMPEASCIVSLPFEVEVVVDDRSFAVIPDTTKPPTVRELT